MTHTLPQRYTVSVSRVISLSKIVTLFRLQFPKDIAFRFVAGQFVVLSRYDGVKEIKRSYSIASTPSETNAVEIIVRRKEGGEMTPWLHSLTKGAEIALQGPYGRFQIHERGREMIFVSAGAGVAPFRGMIADYLHHGGVDKVTLLFGFRTEEDFFFREEFEELARRYPHFTLVPSASQPKDAWKGERGRVTTVLEKYLHDAHGIDVYVCGPPQMIEDTLQSLQRLGFAQEQIFLERWSS